MHGSYIGAVANDENGTPFGDVIGELESLIDGPKLVQALESGLGSANANYYYDTAFIGVPSSADDPNFQGGIADKQYGRDELIDPIHCTTSIDSSESAAQEAPGNRKTITVVGGLLVGCFSIAFILIGYVLYQRQRSYNRSSRSRNNDDNKDKNCGRRDRQDTTNLAVLAGTGSSLEDSLDDDEDIDNNEFDDDGANAFARHYNLDQGEEEDNINNNGNGNDGGGSQNNTEGGSNNNNSNNKKFNDDEKDGLMMMMQQQQQQQQQLNLPQEEEYPDLPMSTEAIRMDLGNSLKGQLMGLHGSTNNNNTTTNNNFNTSGGPYGDGMPINMIGGVSAGTSTGTTSDKRFMIGPGGSHHFNSGGGNGGFFNMNSTSVDGDESDEVDSWAQTDGTIGSLDLQLEPITAEV